MRHGTILAGMDTDLFRHMIDIKPVELPTLVMPPDAPPSPMCEEHARRGHPSVFCSECFSMNLKHWQDHARPPTRAERLYNALTGDSVEE